jgi:hypothetical protein
MVHVTGGGAALTPANGCEPFGFVMKIGACDRRCRFAQPPANGFEPFGFGGRRRACAGGVTAAV